MTRPLQSSVDHDRPQSSPGLPPGYELKPDWELTPSQVKEAIERGESLTILDCRTPGEHAAARLDGARLIPMNEIAMRVNELEDLRAEQIVVYCHHGVRSMRVTAFLRHQGFTNVKSMAGGIDAWSVGVDPATPRY